MKNRELLIGLVTILAIFGCTSNQQHSIEKFHGMWRLDKFEALDTLTNSRSADSTRIGVTGYILYDGQGHMGVHLSPQGYKDFDAGGSIDSMSNSELKAIAQFYQSNFVYFADYALAETTIEHKRLSATDPRTWGTPLMRNFDFIGDTLILTAHEHIDGRKLRLRWIKL